MMRSDSPSTPQPSTDFPVLSFLPSRSKRAKLQFEGRASRHTVVLTLHV
jgi:hypothetical protein